VARPGRHVYILLDKNPTNEKFAYTVLVKPRAGGDPCQSSDPFIHNTN
jgi:hypothetical protein